MDPDIKEMFKVVLDMHMGTEKSITELTRLIGQSHSLLEAAHQRIEASHESLEAAIRQYVEVADARMRRIEDNLDGLIRAITSEHTNGKGRRKQ